jgi:hypothetical protein
LGTLAEAALFSKEKDRFEKADLLKNKKKT